MVAPADIAGSDPTVGAPARPFYDFNAPVGNSAPAPKHARSIFREWSFWTVLLTVVPLFAMSFAMIALEANWLAAPRAMLRGLRQLRWGSRGLG